MEKLLFIILLFAPHLGFAEGFKLKRSIFEKVNPVQHMGNPPWGSYLSMNIKFAPAKELFHELDEKLRGTLNKEEARTEAHITVVTPVEFDKVLKEKVSIKEIHKIASTLNIQDSSFEALCLGRGEYKDNHTYYIVVRSKNLLRIRQEIFNLFKKRGGNTSQFDPHLFYPHITIGYTDKDLHLGSHGVKKGLNSCYSKLSLF